ncbi:MAG: cysteine synthase A [Kiritimatiellae bacterium]|nr:cysteine synthase A [Kiritimatiellia bacterium]
MHILKLIGATPLIEISPKLNAGYARVLAKIEFFNPGGSVKDRVALSMIEAAEAGGKLQPGSVIIEPTSGNTGVGLAMVSAVKGYKLILVMPESMSIERRRLAMAYGAKIVLTESSKGMKGSIDKANELNRSIEGSVVLQQFENPANPESHYLTTGPEIWSGVSGKVDIFVAAVGTGGTFSGTGKYLKEQNPNIKLYAVEPEESAVLSGRQPGLHKIQGIGAGFIPKTMDVSLMDGVIKVSYERALLTARSLASREGIFAGISSGAALAAALSLSENPENKGKTIVTILPDTGERYLSSGIVAEENNDAKA